MDTDLARMGWWDWLGVIAFGLGIMAIPTILQMWFGRRKLIASFRVEHRDADRSLQIFLTNPPLKEGSWLDKIGVERNDIKSLSVSFRITIAGGADIIPVHHAALFTDANPDVLAWRIALPPTYVGAATTVIVSWNSSKRTAVVPPDRLRTARVLPAGRYIARFVFSVNGKTRIVTRSFIVGIGADDLKWVMPNAANLHAPDEVSVLEVRARE